MLTFLRILILALGFPAAAFGYGELLTVRVPEEIPEGDNFTVIVTATGRETTIDRVLVLEYPEGCTLQRAYAVEAGSDWASPLVNSSSIARLYAVEPKYKLLALTDTSQEFNPDAPGIAYFLVFSAAAAPSPLQFKAQLVERINPDTPPEIDKKTKKPKPINYDWKVVAPQRDDFAFTGQKKMLGSIRLAKILRTSRALVLDGPNSASAMLRTHEESLSRFFANPFSIELWFRTT